MFEVTVDQTGDTAEAGDEHAALVAARTLCEDAYKARGLQGFKPTVTFRHDGRVVLLRVTERSVWASLGAIR